MMILHVTLILKQLQMMVHVIMFHVLTNVVFLMEITHLVQDVQIQMQYNMMKQQLLMMEAVQFLFVMKNMILHIVVIQRYILKKKIMLIGMMLLTVMLLLQLVKLQDKIHNHYIIMLLKIITMIVTMIQAVRIQSGKWVLMIK